jgi:hypothetical protein
MSDNFLLVIPTSPTMVPSASAQDRAATVLRSLLPGADRVDATVSLEVRFVDQGATFEGVFCPQCQEDLMESWQEWMEAKALGNFADLNITTPCCGADVSLNDLNYDWPAGFARFVLEAANPGITGWLSESDVAVVEEVLGCTIRQIMAHY